MSRVDFDVSALTKHEQMRYDRQIRLPSFGHQGQLNLKSATILVVGAGGLGCAVLTSLVSAGVGKVMIFDFDHVSISNLHRQPLYTENDVGALKVEVARKRLNELNPHVHIEVRATPILPSGQLHPDDELLIDSADLIIDCTDRFDARQVIARYAQVLGIPHCYGAVTAFEGQVALFRPGMTCFCCLFPKIPAAGVIQSCDQAGVLGVAPQVVGSLQASLALDYLSQTKVNLTSEVTLTQISLSPLRTYQLKIRQHPECTLCSLSPDQVWTPKMMGDRQSGWVIPISAVDVRERLAEGWTPCIIDIRSQEEFDQGSLPQSHLIPLNDLEMFLSRTSLGNSLYHVPSAQNQRFHTLNTIQIEHLLYTGDLLIYCERGPRSERAAVWISTERENLSLPVGRTYELAGGYQSWLGALTHSL